MTSGLKRPSPEPAPDVQDRKHQRLEPEPAPLNINANALLRVAHEERQGRAILSALTTSLGSIAVQNARFQSLGSQGNETAFLAAIRWRGLNEVMNALGLRILRVPSHDRVTIGPELDVTAHDIYTALSWTTPTVNRGRLAFERAALYGAADWPGKLFRASIVSLLMLHLNSSSSYPHVRKRMDRIIPRPSGSSCPVRHASVRDSDHSCMYFILMKWLQLIRRHDSCNTMVSRSPLGVRQGWRKDGPGPWKADTAWLKNKSFQSACVHTCVKSELQWTLSSRPATLLTAVWRS